MEALDKNDGDASMEKERFHPSRPLLLTLLPDAESKLFEKKASTVTDDLVDSYVKASA